MAGFDVVCCIDSDSIETLKENTKTNEVAIAQRDITTLSGDEILELSRTKRSELESMDSS